MSVKRKSLLLILGISLLAISFLLATGNDFPKVMDIREQVETINHITKLRLDTILPQVMRETGFDMWIILTQEDNVDAVFRTMTPMNTWKRSSRCPSVCRC